MMSATDLVKKHEGCRLFVYKDSLGIPTIGWGFNLQRAGAKEALAKADAVLANVLAGAPLTQYQADKLLAADLLAATSDVKRICPAFATLDPQAQAVLVDLSFNLGVATLATFKNTLAAFARKDYSAAADGLEKSLWAKQVGRRAVENCALLRGIA